MATHWKAVVVRRQPFWSTHTLFDQEPYSNLIRVVHATALSVYLRTNMDGTLASNLHKHGVSFEESATVFRDFLSITVPDPDHSQQEERYLTVGESIRGRMLIVAHTEENEGNRIRIISARELTAGERKAYEEGGFK